MLTSFSTALAVSGFLVGSCTSVCGVHVCVFVVEHFLLLSLQPSRPTHYAFCDFYRPVQGLCDGPMGGGTLSSLTGLLRCPCLCAFVCAKMTIQAM